MDACAIRPLKVSECPPRGLAGQVSRNFWDRCPKVVLCLASLLVACQDYPGLQFRAESARGSSEFPSKAFQPVSAMKFWQEGRRQRVDPESAHDPHLEFPREHLRQGPGKLRERDLGSRTRATPSSRPSATFHFSQIPVACLEPSSVSHRCGPVPSAEGDPKEFQWTLVTFCLKISSGGMLLTSCAHRG